MDLAPPGRAAAAATCGVAARADHPIPVCVGEFGPVDLYLYSYAREALRRWLRRRPLSPIFFLANPGAGWSRGWTSGCRGERPDLWGRHVIAGLLRTAAGGLRRALYPLTWCSGSGTR